MTDWSQIKYFTRDEFRFHGDVEPAPELVRKLDEARGVATMLAGRNVPFVITSGIRAPRKNLLAGQLDSAHTTGHAVDIRAWKSRDRFFIIKALILQGFNRLGIYDRHIHVDNSPAHDQDVCWTGRSE